MASLPLLLLLLMLSSASDARDTISPDQPLMGNETLVSAGDGAFTLGFFTPPGSNNTYVGLWYTRVSIRTVVWVANRGDPVRTAVEDNAGATLSVAADGTLAIAGANSTVVWSSSPVPAAAVSGQCTARLLDYGNLVVSDASGGVVWQGFEHPTDTLLSEMRLGVDFATGKNFTLTAWTSPSDPSPGSLSLIIDTSGADPEQVVCNGPTKVWRSGRWDGELFTGIPESGIYKGFTFGFVNSAQEATYSYQLRDAGLLTRLTLNSTGVLQRWLWRADAAGAWNLYWHAPKDQCDTISWCGPNGVCDTNGMPLCSCLPGFAPLSPEAWALWDSRSGCVRKTPLDYANGTDGFAVLPHAKAPDTTSAVVDRGGSLGQCRQRCLANCSCTAYASFNISAEPSNGGCVMWTGGLADLRVYPEFGQDIYVRLSAADLDSTSKSKKKVQVIVAVTVSISAFGILVAIWFSIWTRKRTIARISGPSHGDDLDLPLFDLETIAAATEGFSTGNKLGEGGYGPVYKGKLEDGQEIAVKTLSKTSAQGPNQFKNEVMLIAKLQHRNLVRLIGCCICRQEKIIIYEYMANKSLDYFLFDKSRGTLLDWPTRYRIIEGIARGLLYLHQDSRYRVVHRDLKTSNILLDREMTPKISDFGIARIFGGGDTEINTTRVAGTYGYMAPEYAMAGVFSMKSDVFSFGVIVLEIISGTKNRPVYCYSNHENLLAHVWSLFNEGGSLDIVDETLKGTFDSDEVLKCLKMGLLCVQENPEDRPHMSQVLRMLAAADIALLPTSKQPGYALRRAATEEILSSKSDSSFAGGMTFTVIEGR